MGGRPDTGHPHRQEAEREQAVGKEGAESFALQTLDLAALTAENVREKTDYDMDIEETWTLDKTCLKPYSTPVEESLVSIFRLMSQSNTKVTHRTWR